MNWLALIPLVWVLWFALLACGYWRMFNGREASAQQLRVRVHRAPTPNARAGPTTEKRAKAWPLQPFLLR
jgi:hypothetical protein